MSNLYCPMSWILFLLFFCYFSCFSYLSSFHLFSLFLPLSHLFNCFSIFYELSFPCSLRISYFLAHQSVYFGFVFIRSFAGVFKQIQKIKLQLIKFFTLIIKIFQFLLIFSIPHWWK